MDHASDLGFRIKRLLEEYEGREHRVEFLAPPNGRENYLAVQTDDGSKFTVHVYCLKTNAEMLRDYEEMMRNAE